MFNIKSKEGKINLGLVILAIILILIATFMTFRQSGKIGTLDSRTIVNKFNKYYNSKERKIIYYASPTCSWCSLETPILEELAEKYELDYYYVDSSKLSTNQRNEVLKKLDREKHSTPLTAIVENGKLIDIVVGYVEKNEYVKFLVKNGLLPETAIEDEKELKGDENITYVSFDEYNKIIKSKERSIIVIGQTTCSHCIAIKPALNSVAEEYGLTINYLNLTELSSDERTDFFTSLKTLKYSDPEFLDKGSIGTPLVLVIKNNKVVNYFSGERTTSQLVKEFKKFGLIS